MGGNSHYTIALHILTVLGLHQQRNEAVMTSEEIASSVNTNPVFIRRILGLLNKARLVTVQRGTGAGWKLSREANKISLVEVYEAIKEKPLFEMHYSMPNQACPVGSCIQPILTRVYDEAEEALKQQLAQSTVADILSEVRTLSV